MKTDKRKLTTRFGPEIRFEVPPQPSVPFRATLQTELEKLQGRLLRDLLTHRNSLELNLLLRHAANEAAALAEDTGYPLLTFPLLLQEKAEAARLYAERQEGIRRRTSGTRNVAA
jgi:hypothetical protein